jgi:hypothetical protein
MSPSTTRLLAPIWGRVPALALILMCALCLPALAQPKKGKGGSTPPPAGDRAAPVSNTGPAAVGDTGTPASEPKSDGKDGKKGKQQGPKTFDFTALDLNGRMRSPQLLYFLERANEELERASLEKRSFIPHMVRSLEEEHL